MKFDVSDITRFEECKDEMFDTIEEQILEEYKQRGYSIDRWDKTYVGGGSRGPITRNRRVNYMAVTKKGEGGFQFMINQRITYNKFTNKIKRNIDINIVRSAGGAIKIFKSLKFVLPIMGLILGYTISAYTTLLSGEYSYIYAMVGGAIGYSFYFISTWIYFKVFSKLSGGSRYSNTILKSLMSRAKPIIKEKIEKWREKDVGLHPEKLKGKKYDNVDVDDPEKLALITFDQLKMGQDAAWKKYGLYLPERRKKYESQLVKLKDDKEFQAKYLAAYKRLEEKDEE